MATGGVGRVSPPSTVTTAPPWGEEGLQRGPGLTLLLPRSPGQRAQAGWPGPSVTRLPLGSWAAILGHPQGDAWPHALCSERQEEGVRGPARNLPHPGGGGDRASSTSGQRPGSSSPHRLEEAGRSCFCSTSPIDSSMEGGTVVCSSEGQNPGHVQPRNVGGTGA